MQLNTWPSTFIFLGCMSMFKMFEGSGRPVMVIGLLCGQHPSYVSVDCQCLNFCDRSSSPLGSCDCRPTMQPNNWPAPFICFCCVSMYELLWSVFPTSHQLWLWNHCAAEHLTSTFHISWLHVNVSVNDHPVHSPVVALSPMSTRTNDQQLSYFWVAC